MAPASKACPKPKSENEKLGLLVLGVIVYCSLLMPFAVAAPLIAKVFGRS